MDRNAILNAMEKKAKSIFDNSDSYHKEDKRGMIVVTVRDPENPGQWDSTCRNFGVVYRDYTFDGELVINNGTNFDSLVHGKVAFSRRKGLNSGTNYYQVLGYESFFKGSIISDDGDCICAFAGISQEDDEIIAQAGITCYESLLKTGSGHVKSNSEPKPEGSKKKAEQKSKTAAKKTKSAKK